MDSEIQVFLKIFHKMGPMGVNQSDFSHKKKHKTNKNCVDKKGIPIAYTFLGKFL